MLIDDYIVLLQDLRKKVYFVVQRCHLSSILLPLLPRQLLRLVFLSGKVGIGM